MVKCDKEECGYYRKYHMVQKYKGGYLPVFGSVDERCDHPSVTVKNEDDAPGIKLILLRKCPK